MDQDAERQVYVTSNRAYTLAKESVTAAEWSGAEQSARELKEQLDRLWEQISARPPDDPGVARAWSDAQLDVLYVLSHGELAPSPRLATYLAEQQGRSAGDG